MGKKFHCNEEGHAMLAAGIISTVQDAITALLPNFIYWKSQIPFRQKAALMGIFATAYGVAAFGALRTYATYVLFYETYDVSWQLWKIWNWTLLEFHIGLFCANVPALKVFVKRYLDIKSIVLKPSAPTSQAKSSQIRSQQSKSSHTLSQTSSRPSGKSRSKMSAIFKDPYAHFYTQTTQMTVEEEDEDDVKDMLRCEEQDEKKSDGENSPRSSIRSHMQRHVADDDVEMAILPSTPVYPTQPPPVHRSSRERLSFFLWHNNSDDESIGGFRHLRIEV